MKLSVSCTLRCRVANDQPADVPREPMLFGGQQPRAAPREGNHGLDLASLCVLLEAASPFEAAGTCALLASPEELAATTRLTARSNEKSAACPSPCRAGPGYYSHQPDTAVGPAAVCTGVRWWATQGGCMLCSDGTFVAPPAWGKLSAVPLTRRRLWTFSIEGCLPCAAEVMNFLDAMAEKQMQRARGVTTHCSL